jgi:hypothetical protein
MATTHPHPERKDMSCAVTGSDCWLSAERLWEHGVMGQVDVTAGAVSARNWAHQVPRYIDILTSADGMETVVGTLQDLQGEGAASSLAPENEYLNRLRALTGWRRQSAVVALLHTVERYLYRLSHRQAVRGLRPTFWPDGQTPAGPDECLAVPGLYSPWVRYLQQHPRARHTAEQWLPHLKQAQKRGLKLEELERSGLPAWLARQQQEVPQQRWTPQELLKAIDLSSVRLSVIPMTQASQNNLQMQPPAHSPRLTPVRDGHRVQSGQRRTVAAYDRVLGYRVESLQHDTLWGPEQHWQAVTHEGRPIANQHGLSLLSAAEVAHRLASHHAQRCLPKSEEAAKWRRFALPGGEAYREWLVTLPWYRPTHSDNHYDLRNVLAHVRCDQRIDAAGRRILLLQEMQSDWSQQWACEQRERSALNASSASSLPSPTIAEPPFAREWVSLVLKLVLLHAAWWHLEGIAWLTGEQQATRFGGRGEQWLLTLYDERVPREVNRLLSPHGAKAEPLTLPMSGADAGQGGSVAVHGVTLPAPVRAAILRTGFAAWG